MLLALDTATTTASVAVYDLEKRTLLAEQTWQARRRQTQEVLPTAQQMLAQSGLSPASITALAVTTGPGSFTGVRIAISTAKGIGLGLSRPPRVIGIPTLAVTAAPWLHLVDDESVICAVIQAGRGRFNWAFFGSGDLLWRPTAADHQAGMADELVADLAARHPRPIWLVGEVTDAVADEVSSLSNVVLVDDVSGLRRAGQLARLAALHFAAGVEDDLSQLQPLYLRAPG